MVVLNLLPFNHNFPLSALADCFPLFQGFLFLSPLPSPPPHVNFEIPGLTEEREKQGSSFTASLLLNVLERYNNLTETVSLGI